MTIYIGVKCFSCEVFQVQQEKKSKKFKCKMCGEKQSVRKIYAKSDRASDVRPIVMELNMDRGRMEQNQGYDLEFSYGQNGNQYDDDNNITQHMHLNDQNIHQIEQPMGQFHEEEEDVVMTPISKKSKWDEYLEDDHTAMNLHTEEDAYFTNVDHLKPTKGKRRKRKPSSSASSSTKQTKRAPTPFTTPAHFNNSDSVLGKRKRGSPSTPFTTHKASGSVPYATESPHPNRFCKDNFLSNNFSVQMNNHNNNHNNNSTTVSSAATSLPFPSFRHQNNNNNSSITSQSKPQTKPSTNQLNYGKWGEYLNDEDSEV